MTLRPDTAVGKRKSSRSDRGSPATHRAAISNFGDPPRRQSGLMSLFWRHAFVRELLDRHLVL
jgi:hypothetical protein